MKRIQRGLDIFREGWALHKLSTENYRTPSELMHMYEPANQHSDDTRFAHFGNDDYGVQEHEDAVVSTA